MNRNRNRRLQEKKEELEWLYMELYDDREHLQELEKHLEEFSQARSDELQKLDRQRKKNPDWYKDGNMLGITMYTDLFAKDLKGLAEKIDYLKEQKITYLHLMPLLKMPHPVNDGGYAIEDFNSVDPSVGTNEDLKELTGRLRKAGISLCLDFVVNHTADTHAWAMRAKNGEEEYMARYMCYDTYDIPGQFEQTMPQVFPTTAPGNFTWNEQMQKWVLTTFYPYQWDLNYRNPVVLNEMIYSMLRLANLGVEIFRIDAVPYIWKELGTNCRNLPKVHTIVRIFRLVTEIVCPAVIFKGEVVMAPQELAAYFGTVEKPECHMLYNVSTMVNLWSALASRDTRLLKIQLDKLHSLPDNCYFVNYLRCHDDIGWGLDEEEERKLGIDPLEHKKFLYHFYEGDFPGSFARGELYNFDPVSQDARSCGTTASLCGIEKGGFEQDDEEKELGIQRDLLMHGAMMSLAGFPMLSSGDEIAQVNEYGYHKDPDRAPDSRNLHRAVFNWENAKKRNIEGTVQQKVWSGLAEIERIRQTEHCFKAGSRVSTWDPHNDHVLTLLRYEKDNRLLCVFNFSDQSERIWLDALAGTYENVKTGRMLYPDQGMLLAPYEFGWYRKTISQQ